MGDTRECATAPTSLLDLVRLDPAARPGQLSARAERRYAPARLLALGLLLEPQVLILDEPTTALDILTQRAIIDLLRALRRSSASR